MDMAKFIIRYTGSGCRFPEQVLEHAEDTQILIERDDGTCEELFAGERFNEGTFAERRLQFRRQLEAGVAHVREAIKELGIEFPER